MELRRRPLAPVGDLATCELAALGRLDRLHPFRRDAQRLDEAAVDDAPAVARDRPQRQLLVARNAELSHHQDVQWRDERPRDLEGHGDAAARKRQHDDVVAPGVLLQQPRQPTARVAAIAEPAGRRRGGGVRVRIDDRSLRCQLTPGNRTASGRRPDDATQATARLTARSPAKIFASGDSLLAARTAATSP
jgi:hypothetical protein